MTAFHRNIFGGIKIMFEFFAQCVRAKHARPVLSTGRDIREEHVAIARAPLASEGSGAERLRMRTDNLS